MAKKIIALILILSAIGSVYLTYSSLDKKTHLNTPVINCVPKDASLILHLKKPLTIWYALAETNLIWENLKSITAINTFDFLVKSIDSTLQIIDIQKEREIAVSIHQGPEKIEYLLAFPTDEEEFKLLLNELKGNENTFFKDQKIFKTKDNSIYVCFSSPFTLISSNKNTLQNSISQLAQKEHLLKDSIFKQLYQKNNTSKTAQIYYNNSQLKKLAIPFINKKSIEQWTDKKDWSSLDLIINNNQILLNGLTYFIDNNQSKIETTKRINSSLLPPYVNTIKEQSYQLKKAPPAILNTLNNECNCNIVSETSSWLKNHITEINFGNNEKAFYIALNEKQNLIEKIQELVPIDSVVLKSFDKEIYQLKSTSLNLLLNLPGDEIYFCLHNSQLVISSLKGIKELSFVWKKNKHKKAESNYNLFSEKYLAQKASLNWFSSTKEISKQLKTLLKPEYQSTLEKISKELSNNILIGYQTSTISKNLEHTAIIIKSEGSTSSQRNELWNLTLKEVIHSKPQLLKNHKSKSLDLFVQDSTNTIYLINAAGSIKWSKAIKGKIIGEVQQIDIYGNNKYQALFNTESQIHLIDINGNDVSGYPITLDSKATNSVSVFDYENNHNYRFWISCENLITYNYSKEGKKVSGWNNPKSKAIVEQQFERTVFNQKDFIYTIDKKGNVIFLNRRGESIHKLKKSLNARKGKLKLQKRASLNTSSFIYQDDSTNKIIDYSLDNIEQVIELDKNNTAIDYQIIDIDNNKFLDYLTIYQNKIELYGLDQTILNKTEYLFNVEENHQIVKTLDNNYYIVIKDENSDLLYLLDHHLSQLNKQEITGSLTSTIGDINSDGKLNLITIINNETIKVYSLN